MPTPVSTAKQCLTQDAAQSLDDAVAVARRRGHAQTTSLHAVSAFLSLPSSALRDACGRARNTAYSSRIQFKALELCLGVSLDRLPSSAQRVDDPPVSNSLMAAIKRSQANQRRQPENFQFYQQQQLSSSSSSNSTSSLVKVELQNLILSILDDPVVSRVFAESGFRSYDIKFAILRPVHQILRYQGSPTLLCNFTRVSDLGRRGFSFPFLGFSELFDNDEYFQRIIGALVRKKGRNPLLVGVCAFNVLQNFLEMIQSRRGDGVLVLPMELSGLTVISIENEVIKFVTENYDLGLVKSRIEEMGRVIENFIGPGVVINFGDLKVLVGDDASADAVNYMVRQLGDLLELHVGKVWLIGATARYEIYLKFLNKFPSIEKDWDLQLLPITSPRPPMGETYQSSSLMESFVPFGGFFSTTSVLKSPLSNSNQCLLPCYLSNEKCEQEGTALPKGGFTATVADQYQSFLPSWSQTAELSTNRQLDVAKAKEESMVLSAKVAGLHQKWDNICQGLDDTQPFSQLLPKADTCHMDSRGPAVVGFQNVEDRKENVSDYSSNNTNASSSESSCKNIILCGSVDLQQNSTSKPSTVSAVITKSLSDNFISKLCEKTSIIEDELGGLRSTPCSVSSSSIGDGQTSPTTANSVTTDLFLGIHSASKSKELEKPTNQTQRDLLQDFSGCFSSNVDVVSACITNHTAKSLSCSCPDSHGQFEQIDFKMLHTALANRIGRQEAAVSVISQTIARCRTRNGKRQGPSRGDIWFNFLGPDRIGKKRIALALAEILYGSRESFVCVDLSFQDGIIDTNTIYDRREMNGFDIKFRGKTVVDYIAEELSKKPLSVVFLETIDKADLLVQKSLSQAVRTGRFSDSHGREVSIGNAIFVTTLFTEGNNILSSAKENTNYSEENVLRAKGWPIQMLIGFDLGDNVISHSLRVLDVTRKGSSNPILVHKRKLIGINETIGQRQTLEMTKRAHKASNIDLDLNVRAEDNGIRKTNNGNLENDFYSENCKAWLEDFFSQVDETLVFKPFDFDALAENILQKISECFRKIVGSDGLLEIDLKVVEQILAAVCLGENNRVEDWIGHVLSRAFIEAQKRYNLSSRSVVKLVTCEGLLPEEQAPGVFLPAKIIMN